jgi:hypothetical protein
LVLNTWENPLLIGKTPPMVIVDGVTPSSGKPGSCSAPAEPPLDGLMGPLVAAAPVANVRGAVPDGVAPGESADERDAAV